jgi:hypothetical protein
MSSNYNRDPRIINYHKTLNKNNIKFKNNKYLSFSIIELNYIVNQTEFKYNNDKLYILNLNDYIYFVNRKFLMCKNGFYCNSKKCIYMHIKPNLICSSNYHKNIKCNINICNLIHIRKCNNNINCKRNNCIFLHDKDQK